MQTTKASWGVRAACKVALFAALFCVANVIASLVFGQYASLSIVAWEDFRAAESVGTVFVGSSFAQRAFDPVAFDDALAARGTDQDAGEKGLSYNLATPGQTLPLTADTVEVALESGAKRIVVGMGAESFVDVEIPSAQIAYYEARYKGQPLGLAKALWGVATQPSVIGGRYSLNAFFPWTFNPARSVGAVLNNVRSRVTHEPYGEAAQKLVPDWYYVGRGYGNYDQALTPEDKRTSVTEYGIPIVDERAFEALEQICTTCREAGVELVIVSTPHPDYDIEAVGLGYVQIMERVGQIAQDNGATFLDFNGVDASVMQLELENYGDFEHLNLSGAKKFSEALAQVFARAEAGEDVSVLFERATIAR